MKCARRSSRRNRFSNFGRCAAVRAAESLGVLDRHAHSLCGAHRADRTDHAREPLSRGQRCGSHDRDLEARSSLQRSRVYRKRAAALRGQRYLALIRSEYLASSFLIFGSITTRQ